MDVAMRHRFWPTRVGVALSLALCAATASVWVRSYWVRDRVQWLWTNGSMMDLDAQSESGTLRVSVIDDHGAVVTYHRPELLTWQRDASVGWQSHALWRLAVYREFYAPAGYLTVEFPDWVICAASAVPAVLALRRRTIHSARVRGRRCPSCGYDLRATPDRCPECGRPVGASERGSTPDN
jgi:hypothetical protein